MILQDKVKAYGVKEERGQERPTPQGLCGRTLVERELHDEDVPVVPDWLIRATDTEAVGQADTLPAYDVPEEPERPTAYLSGRDACSELSVSSSVADLPRTSMRERQPSTERLRKKKPVRTPERLPPRTASVRKRK